MFCFEHADDVVSPADVDVNCLPLYSQHSYASGNPSISVLGAFPIRRPRSW
jgi:hypothetical protein